MWDDAREAQRGAYWCDAHGCGGSGAASSGAAAGAAGGGAAGGGAPREGRAVFRGGVYRLNTYTAHWRRDGARRTPLSAGNWRDVGRTALLRAVEDEKHAAAAAGRSALLDVHLRHEARGYRAQEPS